MVDSWTRKAPTRSRPKAVSTERSKAPAQSASGDLGPGYEPGKRAPNPPSMPAKGSATAPAVASSSTSNVRETTLKMNGKEHVVRTTHKGSQKRLETMHGLAVTSKLAELRAPKVQKAQSRLDASLANGASKTTVKKHEKAVRQTKNPSTNPTHSEAFNAARQPLPSGRYDPHAANRVKAFTGDGPKNPKQSHNYGLDKK